MNRIFLSILTGLAILFISPAMTSLAWDNTLNATTNDSVNLGTQNIHKFDAATDSGWLFVGKCSSISTYVSATGSPTVHFRQNIDTVGACSTGTILTVDKNGDGSLTSSDETVWDGSVGNRGMRNVRPTTAYLCVDVVSVSSESRVVITCNP